MSHRCVSNQFNKINTSIFRFVILCFFSFLLVGCSDSPEGEPLVPEPPTPPLSQIVSIEVTPFIAKVIVGSVQQYKATAIKEDGTSEDITAQAIWLSDDEQIASHQGDGAFGGVSSGDTMISASFETFTAKVNLFVIQGEISHLVITPSNLSQPAGSYAQLSAIAYLSDKSTVDVTEQVKWSSSDETIASTTSTGFSHFISLGTAVISIDLLGTTATVDLTVTSASLVELVIDPIEQSIPNGVSVQFQAIGIYSDGSFANVTKNATWASDNTDVAIINSDALAATHSEGLAIISVNYFGFTTNASLTVSSAALIDLQIIPDDIEKPEGTSGQLVLLAQYSDGSIINVAPFAQWYTDDSTIANVNPSGDQAGFTLFTLRGETHIHADYQGSTSSVKVVVTKAILEEISLSPLDSSMSLAGVLQFTAIGLYSNDSTENLTEQVSWQSSNVDIATIDTQGNIQALQEGITLISALKDDVVSQTSLTITSALLTQVNITPTTVMLPIGSLESLQAIATFDDGSSSNVTTSGLWNSHYESIAYVKPIGVYAGLLLGRAEGETNISFSYQGMSNTIEATVTSATLTDIIISPLNSAIASGQFLQYYATGVYSDGSYQDFTEEVMWKSSDTTTASIDLTGLVKGESSGTVIITASFSGLAKQVSLTVSQAQLTAVDIIPGDFSQPEGISGKLRALALYSDGTTAEITSNATWRSSNIENVSVIPSGLDAGFTQLLSVGNATVSIDFNGLSNSIAVEVTSAELVSIQVSPINQIIPQGLTVDYQLTGFFNDGSSAIIVDDINWSSSNVNVAVIDDTGLATALSTNSQNTDTTIISATFNGLSSNTVLSVTDAKLASLAISPEVISLAKGSLYQLSATGTYTDEGTLNVTSAATWHSSDETIVQVIPTGVNAGVIAMMAEGEATITATLGNISNTSSITVTSATLSSITVSPEISSIAAGLALQYTAIGNYSDGSSLPLTAGVSWQSSDIDIASIDLAGVASAKSIGATTIKATFSGVSGQANLTVNNATLINLAIAPANITEAVGITKQLHATAYFTDGTSQNVTNNTTWTSSNNTIVQVNSAGENIGLAVMLANGSAVISANYQGEIASSDVVVSPAILTEIQVIPFVTTLAKGLSVQYSVNGIYSDGNAMPITEGVSWLSSDIAIATIDEFGVASGIKVGTAKITAAVDTLTAEAGLAVTNAEIIAVQILPGNFSQPMGINGQLQALAFFSDGSTFDITANALWSSSDDFIVEVTPSGINAGYATLAHEGSATVSVIFSGLTNSITVTVTSAVLSSLEIAPIHKHIPEGLTVQYTVTGIFTDGSTYPMNDLVAWQSSDIVIATIDQTGLASAITNNDSTSAFSTIIATYLGFSVETDLFVDDAIINDIQITPVDEENPVGLFKQFTATAYFSNGTSEDITRNAVWSSSDDSIVQVVNSGVQAGLSYMTGEGNTNIRAQIGVESDTVNVKVTAAQLVSIDVEPVIENTAAGLSVQYFALGHYTDNSIEQLTDYVDWQSTLINIATIDTNGLATSQMVGVTSITALYQEITGEASLTVTNAEITNLQITPASIFKPVGSTQQLSATAILTDNSILDVTRQVTWLSENNTIASVTSSGENIGLVIMNSQGVATISATYQNIADTIDVNVTEKVLTDIIIDPIDDTIIKGTNLNYNATGKFSDNSSHDITLDVTWQSNDHNIATINEEGSATGVNVGSTTISATLEGIESTVILTVNAPSLVAIQVSPISNNLVEKLTTQYQAYGIFDNAQVIDITDSVVWSTSDNSVATISNSQSGLLTAINIGSANVIAQDDDIIGSAPLTVSAPEVISIAIIAANTNLPKGIVSQWEAEAQYSDGSSVNITDNAAWLSENSAIATVLQGEITAITPGMSNISISYQTFNATQLVTVTEATILTIDASPSFKVLDIGHTQQMTAVAYYSDGSNFVATDVLLWGSENLEIIYISNSINDKGLATALSAGTAKISAEYEGVIYDDIATFDVAALSLQSIIVEPNIVSVTSGSAVIFKAIGVFQDGYQDDITEQVTWSSNDNKVIDINNSGDIIGAGIGEDEGIAIITATSKNNTSITGQANLTVTEACEGIDTGGPGPNSSGNLGKELDDLILKPIDSTVSVHSSIQFELIAVLDGCESNVTYGKGHFHLLNDSDNLVQLGHETGLATGLSPGVATIEGVYDRDNIVTTSLTVIDDEVARVQISPVGPLVTSVGGTLNLTCAMQTISDGALQPEDNITDVATWSVNNAAIVSVEANSNVAQVVQGVSLGTTHVLCQYGGQTGFMTIVVQ